ncbi:aromatic ring-opening dioxygenase LigA [Burkholderia ubonensis]|uniref:hypothetical protein n=1 Tax=Burkholderia ubonensis TaxID=101571 RepID=UPI00075BA3CA|nr:hypothetical protein [Burkholderia ubonensis]KVA73058.1 aromatic ring-opening dioxygenase LigA [Burkholderia ubonensis]KVO63379.1 aromatic ring-opening dioxygenase LigA [Burkholderia ubonensis]KVX39756.1 aromatic ring-opening dioxygenase LigA [Burkholderia ubonensis]KWI13343.1 aromatic ring-opening dioxygenase LigA [Burkholderia ubonensis]KWI88920.1 aromatic ring-opening dioxygenase LigA [Burkholderia ubonensis]
MNIRLRFINRSNDCGNSEVVLFQRDVMPGFDELAIAWKVIRYCGRDCFHLFEYATDIEVALGDEHGNFSPRVAAPAGARFAIDPLPSGRGRLAPGTADAAGGDVEVVNRLTRGAVNVNAFCAGRLIAAKHAVAPGQKAVFRFTPALWIAVASQVQESHALNAAVLSSANTLLPLAGVAAADIVMTGGGTGADAQPFSFALEQVVRR